MCTNPGKRLCRVFGRISSIQLKTATTVQIVREIGARMITPCRNNLSRLRGTLRIVDMGSRLSAKISQYPRLLTNYKKNHGNVGNVKSFRSFVPQWIIKNAY